MRFRFGLPPKGEAIRPTAQPTASPAAAAARLQPTKRRPTPTTTTTTTTVPTTTVPTRPQAPTQGTHYPNPNHQIRQGTRSRWQLQSCVRSLYTNLYVTQLTIICINNTNISVGKLATTSLLKKKVS